MKQARHLAACVGMLAAGFASAQFPVVNTSNATLQTIRSLDSGLRFIDNFNNTSQQRTIYNLDLTVHRVLNYPAPPAGMYWGSMIYITEALFDTDPGTIEFFMTAVPQGGPGSFAVFVFREDGTELFTQNPGSMYVAGSTGINSAEAIFMVEDQAYMLLHQDNVFGPPARIYALPGTLPCTDCYGSPGGSVGMDAGPVMDAATGIRVFPNPAREQITVALGRQHSGAGMVRLYDGQGRLALERPFAAAEQVEVNVGALAQGAYVCQVFVGGRLLSSLPVVVER